MNNKYRKFRHLYAMAMVLDCQLQDVGTRSMPSRVSVRSNQWTEHFQIYTWSASIPVGFSSWLSCCFPLWLISGTGLIFWCVGSKVLSIRTGPKKVQYYIQHKRIFYRHLLFQNLTRSIKTLTIEFTVISFCFGRYSDVLQIAYF